MKVTGSGSTSASGSISQRYGSADPDPYQNFMDPQPPTVPSTVSETGIAGPRFAIQTFSNSTHGYRGCAGRKEYNQLKVSIRNLHALRDFLAQTPKHTVITIVQIESQNIYHFCVICTGTSQDIRIHQHHKWPVSTL